jgi:hypothetical protein
VKEISLHEYADGPMMQNLSCSDFFHLVPKMIAGRGQILWASPACDCDYAMTTLFGFSSFLFGSLMVNKPSSNFAVTAAKSKLLS